jgi:hypothetical protein
LTNFRFLNTELYHVTHMDQSNKQVHCSRNKPSIVTKKTHLKYPLICGGDQFSFIQLQTGVLLYTGSRGLNTGQTFLQKGTEGITCTSLGWCDPGLWYTLPLNISIWKLILLYHPSWPKNIEEDL